MTIIHTVSPRTGGNIYVGRPINVPDHALRGSRDSLARSRRPGPTRPAGAPPRYRGTGVAMSVAPHGRRPVTLATTVGLALLPCCATPTRSTVPSGWGSPSWTCPTPSPWCGSNRGNPCRTWPRGWRLTRPRPRWSSASANSTTWARQHLSQARP